MGMYLEVKKCREQTQLQITIPAEKSSVTMPSLNKEEKEGVENEQIRRGEPLSNKFKHTLEPEVQLSAACFILT